MVPRRAECRPAKRARCGVGLQIADADHPQGDGLLGPSAGGRVKSRPMRGAAKFLRRAATTATAKGPAAPTAPCRMTLAGRRL